MGGLVVICIAVFVGIFAYYLGTDSTPNADRQVVEIMAQKPGFTQLFLLVKKEKQIPNTGFFQRLLFGAEDKYLYVPINSFSETKDSVSVEKFIDERTGYLRRMKTPAVILEGVYCQSRYSEDRVFCPRRIFAWWREVWLEKVAENEKAKIATPVTPHDQANTRTVA